MAIMSTYQPVCRRASSLGTIYLIEDIVSDGLGEEDEKRGPTASDRDKMSSLPFETTSRRRRNSERTMDVINQALRELDRGKNEREGPP